MKVLVFISFIFILGEGVAQTPKRIEAKYDLFWSDEFNGKILDTTKWRYRGTGNQRQFASVSEDNCYLDGEGHLVIETTKKDSNYYVGQIGTQQTLMTRYGYFECRAKVNSQQGPHSAFWLQSPKIQLEINDPKTAGAEIDIFEYHRRRGVDEVHHAIHWNGYGEKKKNRHRKRDIDSLNVGFHTFGVEWTKNRYTFYVDGKKTWSTCRGVSRIEQYLILSMDLMGSGGDFSESVFPDGVTYDYVRVYKRLVP
ncbi:MAG: glycoside hydrolase family 16 protein [Crocinitomicaceae bacterium]